VACENSSNYYPIVMKFLGRAPSILFAILTATAALLAATRELPRWWHDRRKCIAGIGVLTNHRLPFYYFSWHWTVDSCIWKAKLLRLFSTLQNANRTKTKNPLATTCRKTANYLRTKSEKSLLCAMSSLADYSYEGNGGTDIEVLACFRPGFLRWFIILS